jgi:hypothetical protein
MIHPTHQRLVAAALGATAVATAFGALLVGQFAGRPAEAQGGLPVPVDVKAMQIISHNDLGQETGGTSEIWYMNDVVYLGYFGCGTPQGSSIVDVRDPANPKVLFKTEAMSGTFASDVSAISMDTAYFKGDLFLEPHETCAAGAVSEFRFWDTTDPASPKLKSSFLTVDGVHNASPFIRTESGVQQVYVLMSNINADISDNSDIGGVNYEDRDMDADFVVLEITDPANPKIVSRWNIHDVWPTLGANAFLHDAWLNAAGTIAYGSYWDAGLVLIDLADVTQPKLISRTNYRPEDEGNTHMAVETKNGDYLVVTDEDFNPLSSEFRVTAPGAIAGLKPAAPGSFLRLNIGKPPIEGEAVWVGRGCDADPAFGLTQPDPYLNDATGKIAMIVRGGCTAAGKVKEAQAQGAIGAVIVNHTAGAGPWMSGRPAQGTTIGAIGLGWEDGHAITQTLGAGTPVLLRFGVTPGEWGYTRFFDIKDPKNPKQVADFLIPEIRQFPPPASGTYTVHNSWVQGDTLYLSHYAGGVRVLDIADPASPKERAYIVSQSAKGERSSIWGVMTDNRGNIYASDMVAGLWVYREGSPAQGTPTLPAPIPTDTPVPATAVPATPIPATPLPMTAVPTGPVCPQIVGRVPQAAIDDAVANPSAVSGYNQPQDPGKPVGPYNPLRTWLSVHNLSMPYNPVSNRLVYKPGCP